MRKRKSRDLWRCGGGLAGDGEVERGRKLQLRESGPRGREWRNKMCRERAIVQKNQGRDRDKVEKRGLV